MRKLLLIFITVILVGVGASHWYETQQREQLIRSEIKELRYRESAGALTKAARTLGRMGPDAEEAIPALIEVLMLNESLGPDALESLIDVKPIVAGALVAIGPASVEPLLNTVRDPQYRERGWGILPPGDNLRVPPLFNALGRMRTQFGPEFDAHAIDATLNELMNSHDCHDVRLWAERTLCAVEVESGEPVRYPPSPPWNAERKKIAYWTRHVEHEDSFARAWAAHILGDNADVLPREVGDWMGSLPAVAAMVEDGDKLVREESARSLHLLILQAKGKARDVVPALISAIQHAGKKPDPPWSFYEQRLFACLEETGSEAHAAVPLLLTILQDNESEFRPQAAIALGQIAHADAIPALISALDESEHPDLVCASADALGRFGSNAIQAVPQLARLLDDDRTYGIVTSGEHPEGRPITVRETVAEALKKIDPEATQARVRD